MSGKNNRFVMFFLTVALGVFAIWGVSNIKNILPKFSKASSTYVKWYHPNYHYDFNLNFASPQWGNYFLNPSFETDIAKKIDVYGMFILEVGKNNGDFLTNLIPILNRNNVKIAVEAMGIPNVTVDSSGGLKLVTVCSDNATMANIYSASELGVLKKIYDRGGKVSYLSLDDPLARGTKNSVYQSIYTCNGTIDDAIDITLRYINNIHAVYPDIKVGLITNFPNWVYGGSPSYPTIGNPGDYYYILDKFVKTAQSRNIKIFYVNADNPYDYAIGAVPGGNSTNLTKQKWTQRIVDLEHQVKSYGLSFGLIYNSARGGTSKIDNSLLYNDTINYINYYYTSGGRPDNVVIESWYPRPDAMLPYSTYYTGAFTAQNAFALYDSLVGPTPSPVPVQTPVPVSDQSSLMKPVVKYVNTQQPITLLTISQTEGDSAVSKYSYKYVGNAFNAWTSQGSPSSKLLPVFRLQKPNNGYLYTISDQEKNDAVKIYGYTYETIAFYAYGFQATGTLPVYRLSKKNLTSGSRFLYTISETEKNSLISAGTYNLDGIAFYASN